MLPAAKHWICKRTPTVIAEALECLGGNGYVEESVMPRLYRDAPLNSIWEGSGNVTALDLLRALARSPGGVEALRAELAPGGRRRRRLDRGRRSGSGASWPRSPPTRPGAQYQARALAGLLTLVTAGGAAGPGTRPPRSATRSARPGWPDRGTGSAGLGSSFGTLPRTDLTCPRRSTGRGPLCQRGKVG